MIYWGIVAVVALCVIFTPFMAQSEGILWDLIIQANLETSRILQGQVPTVTGQITDHAGKPVQGVGISIKSGLLSWYNTTNENGDFEQRLTGFDGLPGRYIVNIKAEEGDRTGWSTLQFQVYGDVTESQVLFRQIDTPTARKYIESSEGDFVNDPIGLQLHLYYKGIYDKYIEALVAERHEREKQAELSGQRDLASRLLQKEIEEKNPGVGVYHGWAYERFVDNLDRSVKDTIVSQLNHTTSAFYEARELMKSMLENGKTYEEARQAYLDRLAITQEMMISMEFEEQTITNSTDTESTEHLEKKDTVTAKHDSGTNGTGTNGTGTNGTGIEVETSGNTIFINVNGTIIEFVVNGTQVVQVTNSTQR